MTLFKRITACLLLACTLLPLVSCNDPAQGDGGDTTDALPPLPESILVDPEVFRVIRAEEASALVREAATELTKVFREATGKLLPLGNDFDYAPSEDAYEILVGVTNRAISAELHAALKPGEFIIKLVNEKQLVILGYDDWELKKAVAAFIKTYLPYDAVSETYQVNQLKVPGGLHMLINVHEQAENSYGFTVDKDGTILLGGKPFQAVGVNWHGAFDRIYYHRDETDMDVYFRTLKENNIPYFRLMMGVFYQHEYDEYVKNRTAYFEAMDELVALAEKYEIGMICSLMWAHGALWNYNGEPVTALADENSKTIKFAKGYVKDVVGRYVDSPAIWGWEIGNEGNLDADILEGMSTEVLSTYYTIIGETIAAIDPNRMLTGGDAYPRHASKALRENGSWSPADTREDVIETFGYYTPAPLNTISVHIYGEKGNDAYVDECISDLRAKANALNIGAFVGEFGTGGNSYNPPFAELDPEDPREAQEEIYFKHMVDLFLESNVQVLCAWSYGRYIQLDNDGTSIEYGMYNGVYQNAYQIDYMREKNNALQEQGLNCAAEYWANVKKG